MELKMKKATRVVIAGACAGALALGAALPAFAAGTDPKSGQTKVSYNTSTTIDPGADVGWVVNIPSSLSFDLASAKSGVDVKVTLASKLPGTPLSSLTDIPGHTGTAPGSVEVHVVSRNGMALQLTGSDGTSIAGAAGDPLAYKIVAGTNTISSSSSSVKGEGVAASLTGPVFGILKQPASTDTKTTEVSVKGTATVDGTPTKDGDHTDVLTFGFNSKA